MLYFIATAATKKELEAKVRSALADGWVLQGGVNFATTPTPVPMGPPGASLPKPTWMQAMTREAITPVRPKERSNYPEVRARALAEIKSRRDASPEPQDSNVQRIQDPKGSQTDQTIDLPSQEL